MFEPKLRWHSGWLRIVRSMVLTQPGSNEIAFQYIRGIYVTELMFCVNRTTSMPKFVLHYDVDKDLTLVWYSVFTQSCFPNKETYRQRRVNQFIL